MQDLSESTSEPPSRGVFVWPTTTRRKYALKIRIAAFTSLTLILILCLSAARFIF